MRATSYYDYLSTDRTLFDGGYTADITDACLFLVGPHAVDQRVYTALQRRIHGADVFAGMLEIAHHIGEAVEVVHRLQTG